MKSSLIIHSRKINLIIEGTNQEVIFEKEEEKKIKNNNSYSSTTFELTHRTNNRPSFAKNQFNYRRNESKSHLRKKEEKKNKGKKEKRKEQEEIHQYHSC